jgi:hypothetical protein
MYNGEREDLISTRIKTGNQIIEPRRPDTSLQPSKSRKKEAAKTTDKKEDPV